MSTDRLREGDSWHLHSKNGIYQIYRVLVNGDFLITCDKWKNEFDRGERKTIYQRVPASDLKCKAGIPYANGYGSGSMKARQIALNKLTEKEKQLLGLK